MHVQFLKDSITVDCFSEPIPRKGTETWIHCKTRLHTHSIQFFRTYSPQGDGNYSLNWFLMELEKQPVFQNLFPARGRKLPRSRVGFLDWSNFKFFRTYSPQGDGNAIGSVTTNLILSMFFRTYSPQGDGNIPSSCVPESRLWFRFSEPIPRKGTETLLWA